MEQQVKLIAERNLLLGIVYAEDGGLIYTVIRGATLAIICTKCDVDYWKNYDDILEINSLDNENQTKVGQILMIPGCPFNR